MTGANARGVAPLRDVIRRLAPPTLVTYVLLVVLSRVPIIDSTTPPYVDLGAAAAQVPYWLAESGGTVGGPILAAIALLLLVTRPAVPGRRRGTEALALAMLVSIGAGGGAAINERGLKAALEVPRPNVVSLAGVDGNGPLGRTPAEFYALGDKDVRSDSLRAVLMAEPAPVDLIPSIREHWVHETGYSFPSGHAFSAMFIAVFFLAAALSYAAPGRGRLFHALLLWALLVGLSRPVLRVHTPMDVAIGAAQGIALGFLAFLALRVSLDRSGRWPERTSESP